MIEFEQYEKYLLQTQKLKTYIKLFYDFKNLFE